LDLDLVSVFWCLLADVVQKMRPPYLWIGTRAKSVVSPVQPTNVDLSRIYSVINPGHVFDHKIAPDVETPLAWIVGRHLVYRPYGLRIEQCNTWIPPRGFVPTKAGRINAALQQVRYHFLSMKFDVVVHDLQFIDHPVTARVLLIDIRGACKRLNVGIHNQYALIAVKWIFPGLKDSEFSVIPSRVVAQKIMDCCSTPDSVFLDTLPRAFQDAFHIRRASNKNQPTTANHE